MPPIVIPNFWPKKFNRYRLLNELQKQVCHRWEWDPAALGPAAAARVEAGVPRRSTTAGAPRARTGPRPAATGRRAHRHRLCRARKTLRTLVSVVHNSGGGVAMGSWIPVFDTNFLRYFFFMVIG